MAFTKENARELGKRGGRPKGRLNTGKLLLREIAAMVVTDAHVQETLLKQARNGTIHPSVLVALMWTHGGKPVSAVEIRRIEDSRPDGLTIQQQEDLLKALPPAEFEKFVRMTGVVLGRAREGDVSMRSTSLERLLTVEAVRRMTRDERGQLADASWKAMGSTWPAAGDAVDGFGRPLQVPAPVSEATRSSRRPESPRMGPKS